MKILVSACLLGVACRYDGKTKPQPWAERLAREHEAIPVCPEILGGLPTPRCPSECQGSRVVNRNGEDVTAQYRRGAEETLKLARLYGCRLAVLKERSPACGSVEIYDGSFAGHLTPGSGVAARLLKENGIPVIGESMVQAFLEENAP